MYTCMFDGPYRYAPGQRRCLSDACVLWPTPVPTPAPTRTPVVHTTAVNINDDEDRVVRSTTVDTADEVDLDDALEAMDEWGLADEIERVLAYWN